VSLSRDVLQYVKNYCVLLRSMQQALQPLLMSARASGMPVDIVAIHDSLISKYKEKEQELRSEIEEMTQRTDELQNGLE
jgi:hypothetical protein